MGNRYWIAKSNPLIKDSLGAEQEHNTNMYNNNDNESGISIMCDFSTFVDDSWKNEKLKSRYCFFCIFPVFAFVFVGEPISGSSAVRNNRSNEVSPANYKYISPHGPGIYLANY